MRGLIVLFLMICIVFIFVTKVAAEGELARLDASAQKITDNIKEITKGKVGFMIFLVACVSGVIALLTRHPKIALFAFVGGFLLASIYEIAQFLWQSFGGTIHK
ncbi:MAG: hypothetical protein AB1488_06615 [Nitrospirota bacterium]